MTTDPKALIAEARESADRVEYLGPDIASLLRRLAAALEEATKAERLAGTLAVTLRVNAYRAGWKTEDDGARINRRGHPLDGIW